MGKGVIMSDQFKKNPYEDMLDLPYPFPTNRPRMSMYDRAAQFGSFAALTGHEEAIEETARLTSVWVEPDESVKEQLNRMLQIMSDMLSKKETVRARFVYFLPDEKKMGGSYEQVAGEVKKLDPVTSMIVMLDETSIPIKLVTEIELLQEDENGL